MIYLWLSKLVLFFLHIYHRNKVMKACSNKGHVWWSKKQASKMRTAQTHLNSHCVEVASTLRTTCGVQTDSPFNLSSKGKVLNDNQIRIN